MQFRIIKNLEEAASDTFVLFLPKGNLGNEIALFDKKYDGKVKTLLGPDGIDLSFGEIHFFPKSYLGDKRLIIVGIGEVAKITEEKLKKVFGTTAKALQAKKQYEYTFVIPKSIAKKVAPKKSAELAVVANTVSPYHFHEYISDEKAKHQLPKIIEIVTFASIDKKRALQIIKEAQALGESINFTRDLGNLPPLEMTPTYMGRQAQKLAAKYPKLKVKVLGRTEIKREKMGGLLGVSLGSDQEPKFIIMEWMNAKKSDPTYVFVGKAITFDSGGISIKPSQKMDEMKFDMLGGGAVMGALKTVAELNLKINLVGLIPSSENLLGGRAYRPGDILRARNGKTIEVQNTDAEGRIILADALSYAKDYDPKFVFDLATLTGSCMVALGEGHQAYAGLFTRKKNYEKIILEAAQTAGEKVWPLPLDDDFSEMVKSKVADVANVGSSRYAGASTAAAFLENFTDYDWAHLDIAGVGWGADTQNLHSGASGFGVNTLVELAKKFARK